MDVMTCDLCGKLSELRSRPYIRTTSYKRRRLRRRYNRFGELNLYGPKAQIHADLCGRCSQHIAKVIAKEFKKKKKR